MPHKSSSGFLLCVLTCVRLQLFEAVAVCRAWRRAGKRLFFAQPWDACTTICHPLQLFSLVSSHPAHCCESSELAVRQTGLGHLIQHALAVHRLPWSRVGYVPEFTCHMYEAASALTRYQTHSYNCWVLYGAHCTLLYILVVQLPSRPGKLFDDMVPDGGDLGGAAAERDAGPSALLRWFVPRGGGSMCTRINKFSRWQWCLMGEILGAQRPSAMPGPSALLRCFVRREGGAVGDGGAVRFMLYHGMEHTEPKECKFLLAAKLTSRCGLWGFMGFWALGFKKIRGRCGTVFLCTALHAVPRHGAHRVQGVQVPAGRQADVPVRPLGFHGFLGHRV